jgi:hypothetical protein
MTTTGQLQHGNLCLAPPTPAYSGANLILLPCGSTPDQLWEKRQRTNGHALVHKPSSLCMDARNTQEITIHQCQDDQVTQVFVIIP